MDIDIKQNYLDCIKDSPLFRKNVDNLFSKIVNFQDVITEVSDSFTQSIKSGIVFSCHYQSFCSKMEKLNKLYPDKDSFPNDLEKILKIFCQFKEHFKILMENFHTIQKEFKCFQDNFKEIEACKKLFQKSGENLEACQIKCSGCPKSKINECIEVDKQCNTMRKEFTQTSLNYLSKIEKYDIYKQSAFLCACTKIAEKKRQFYMDGNIFMQKFDPWIDDLKQNKCEYDKRYEEKCQETTAIMSNFKISQNRQYEDGPRNVVIEGYLYKYPRKSWQKWQRRWFCITGNQLLSCKRNEDAFHIVEEDLRICTAKELADSDRRFCFELIGLDHTYVLQADSDESQRRWIACFQNGMCSQMGTLGKQNNNNRSISVTTPGGQGEFVKDKRRMSSHSTTGGGSKRSQMVSSNKNDIGMVGREDRKTQLLTKVLKVRGNNLCCDCNDEKPRWASSSLGITLCTECSGSHRSLGVHISKVRSLTLDNWEPEMLCVMFMLGNDLVNQIYESDKEAIVLVSQSSTNKIIKPDSNTDMSIRKEWTRAKWERKQFIQSNMKELLANLEKYIRGNMSMFASSVQDGYPFTSSMDLLRHGLEIQCLPLMMLALALNANSNGDENEDFIPLHLAASIDFWPGCEFLILNGAKIDIVDKDNQTALHKACQNENVLVVWLLLKRGARHNIRDKNDNEVLQIAMTTTNANTVTLLRLQMLNENTKEANLGSSGDETVNDVFRDFTNRAFDKIDEWFNSESGKFHRMSSSNLLTSNNTS